MRAVFILGLFLAIVFHINGKPVEENEADLENWEAPVEISKQLPYYLSGYDEQGRPIWVFELGKYPLKTLLDQGPETMEILEKYLVQIALHFRKSARDKNPENELQDVIIDFEGFDFKQFSDPRTIAFIIEMVQKMGLHEYDTGDNIFLVNVSAGIKSLLNVAGKGFGQIFSKFVILGKNKEDKEWKDTFIKTFPADQLPEWYGGSNKDFKPIKVFG